MRLVSWLNGLTRQLSRHEVASRRRRQLRNVSALVAGAERLEERVLLSTYTVINTDDSGTGSLRQAILNANANPGVDTIDFDISASDVRHFYYRDNGLAGSVTLANVTPTIAATDAITDIDPDWAHSWWSIRPSSNLPSITGSVIIDGYTQGGDTAQAGSRNSNGPHQEIDAVLRIEVDGSGLSNGLVLGGGGPAYGSGSTVRGLAINGVSGFGISLNNGGHTIQGNFIGTDPSGTLPKGNLQLGILLNGGSFNRIGTDGDGISDATERNLISANGGGFGSALRLTSSADNVIAGNFIGVDRTGGQALGNTNQAVIIFGLGSDRNRIGTNGDGVSDDLERNIISGTKGGVETLPWGIQIRDAVHDNVVAGNYIGTDVTGTKAIGNGFWGVLVTINAFNNRVGIDPGHVNYPAERNVISGNLLGGVALGDNAHDNVVWGNYIGTQADGTSPLGNGEFGVAAGRGASNNQIGSPGLKANVIAFNGWSNNGAGVLITNATRQQGGTPLQDSPYATGNAIRGNSIHSNGISGQSNRGLGIDLGGIFEHPSFKTFPNGRTLNDAGDGDVGANKLQNYPVLNSAQPGTSTRVIGTLNSTASQTFTLDFYANPVADPTGFGEGQRYLGSATVTTNTSGNAAFDSATLNIPLGGSVSGEFITATATDVGGNTSEFSADIAAVNQAPSIPVDNDAALNEIAEGAVNGTPVGITAHSSGDNLTYTLTADAGGRFAINATTGVVTVANGALLNYETGTSHDITVQASNSSGASTATFTISVVNINPATPIDIDPTANTVEEGAANGTPVGITASSIDPNGPEVTYILTDDAEGRFAIDAVTGMVTVANGALLDGPRSHTVTIQAADGAGGTSLADFTIFINNVAPILSLLSNSSPDCGMAGEGQAVTISGTFTDMGTQDTHTASIDWGDGNVTSATISESGGSGSLSGTHAYTAGGIYTVTVTLTDDDTGTDVKTTTTVVAGVGVVGDTLYVIGTEDADHVTINEAGSVYRVHADFLTTGSFRDVPVVGVSRIIVQVCDGDDLVVISGGISLPALIDGGEGSDKINGGGGPTVIVGGAGDDDINGGSSRDLLIGGLGADRIVGNAGEDLIIAGTTDSDALYAALLSLLDEWSGAGSAEARMSHILSGGGANMTLLNSTTVHDDGAVDKLTGSSAIDWFFANLAGNGSLDLITDKANGELVQEP